MGRLRGAGLQSCGRRPRRPVRHIALLALAACCQGAVPTPASHFGYTPGDDRSEEHTSELQSLRHLVCRLLLEKKKYTQQQDKHTYTLSLDPLWSDRN